MSLGEKSQVSFLKVILEALLTKKYGGSSERGQTLQDFLFPWPQDSVLLMQFWGSEFCAPSRRVSERLRQLLGKIQIGGDISN